MAAQLLTVADAVVSELNTQAALWLPQVFTAKRSNVPRLSRESAASLTVTVTPKSRTTVQLARNTVQGDHEIFIGIQKAIPGDANADTDPFVNLGETIAEYFDDGRRLATMATAVCVKTEFGGGTDSQWMSARDQDGILLYTGIVILTFRVFR